MRHSNSKAFFIWFGVCFVSLLVMVRPASADVKIMGLSCRATVDWVNVVFQINGFDYKYTSCTGTTAGSSCTLKWYNPTAPIGWFANSPPTFPVETCEPPPCPVGETRNATTGICEPTVTCPHTYLGQNVSDGWGLTTQNISLSYGGCDQYGCAVQVNKISSVFGVTLARQFALSSACAPASPLAPLTVTLQQADPQVVDYDAVVAKAAALDAAKTAAEKEVVDRLKAELKKSEDDLKLKAAELSTSVTDQQTAAKNLSDAATVYLNNPTPANLQSFEAFKAEYAAKSAASRLKLTQATSTWTDSRAKRRDAELLKTEAAAQQQKIAELDAAIQKSGAQYDPVQVQAVKGDTAGLDEALAAAQAQQDALAAQIDAMNAALNAMIAKMNGFGQAVEEAIRRMQEAGAPPPPPEEQPVDTSPVEPPTPDFCTTNPNDPTCATTAPVTGGALPTLSGSWYTKKYPAGLGGVMSNNFTTMKATPLFAVITDIVPTISGSAHTGCFTIEIWRIGTQQLCIPQIVMQALGVFMLLTAVFAARAIIFGG